MAFDPVQPFVLLDDARAGRARLFSEVGVVVEAAKLGEVGAALVAVRAMGGNRAGFLSFEAGAALTSCPPPGTGGGQAALPLVWFARFDRVETFDDAATDALLDAGHASIGPARPRIERVAYDHMLARIAELIAAGDVYQVNATFAADVATRGHPLALYRRLRRAQAAPHCALIHTGRDWLLSLSPELLFDLSGRALTTRPMKGTAARGATAAADDAAAAELAADPKNRAENLMIVDLLRNDLSRVAEPGSVAVPQLFAVERYPTVLQMTSTVTALARSGIDAVDVLAALFPCGSVTGAPKIRALEVIAELEAAPRGAYTGSIGAIDASGDATFNVAIRTLTMQPGGGARMGLGGGIVADSEVTSEWAEALAKGAFLTRSPARVDLIETMRFEPGIGLVHRELHLDRLAASAGFLGHRLDLVATEAALAAATERMSHPGRIRLLLARSGAVSVQASPLPPTPAAPVAVKLVPLPVAASDWRLRHKTSDRAFYDDARRAAGSFEVVFVRPDGGLTEGSFTNVFVERDRRMLTPPLGEGLLPGVLRAALITEGRAIEARLTAADLVGGFLIGNSLRGLIRARLGAPAFP
ncbi:aminodeoxychorismate synthase component I [Sphingosinicellaceae bacterium]|nr:aminodeoxychorismate synthase component I [Sphingosinicellaceae bacterium]